MCSGVETSMNPNVKGAVAEQAIVLAATKLRVPVWRPVAEHGRADRLLEIAGYLLRVQVKWGRLSPRGDVVIVQLRTSRHTPKGYVHSTYTESEVDLIAVYCGDLNRCYLLPISLVAGMKQIHLRLEPTRNRQRACITLADDFDFDGAIAQLGERCHGMAEVAGSSPASSTPPSDDSIIIGSNPFRDRLGYWMEKVAAGDQVLVTRRGKPRVRLSPANPPLPSSNGNGVWGPLLQASRAAHS
jgi:antitoxin (DNA-binding transcriptional repressor) of toxin-antitoxin stability system